MVGKKRIFVDSCSALSVESAHGLTREEKSGWWASWLGFLFLVGGGWLVEFQDIIGKLVYRTFCLSLWDNSNDMLLLLVGLSVCLSL